MLPPPLSMPSRSISRLLRIASSATSSGLPACRVPSVLRLQGGLFRGGRAPMQKMPMFVALFGRGDTFLSSRTMSPVKFRLNVDAAGPGSAAEIGSGNAPAGSRSSHGRRRVGTARAPRAPPPWRRRLISKGVRTPFAIAASDVRRCRGSASSRRRRQPRRRTIPAPGATSRRSGCSSSSPACGLFSCDRDRVGERPCIPAATACCGRRSPSWRRALAATVRRTSRQDFAPVRACPTAGGGVPP